MDFVGAVIRNKIKELGQLWKSSENHVNVSIDVLNSWDTLMVRNGLKMRVCHLL